MARTNVLLVKNDQTVSNPLESNKNWPKYNQLKAFFIWTEFGLPVNISSQGCTSEVQLQYVTILAWAVALLWVILLSQWYVHQTYWNTEDVFVLVFWLQVYLPNAFFFSTRSTVWSWIIRNSGFEPRILMDYMLCISYTQFSLLQN